MTDWGLIKGGMRAFIDASHEAARDKGFWDDPQPVAVKLCLIHSEVSEAMEADRAGEPREHVIEELFDVMIRAADLIGALEDPMLEMASLGATDVLVNKMKKNLTRPPKHGKKY